MHLRCASPSRAHTPNACTRTHACSHTCSQAAKNPPLLTLLSQRQSAASERHAGSPVALCSSARAGGREEGWVGGRGGWGCGGAPVAAAQLNTPSLLGSRGSWRTPGWLGGWAGRRQPGSAQLRPTLRVLPELRREEEKEGRAGERGWGVGGRADGVMLRKP